MAKMSASAMFLGIYLEIIGELFRSHLIIFHPLFSSQASLNLLGIKRVMLWFECVSQKFIRWKFNPQHNCVEV